MPKELARPDSSLREFLQEARFEVDIAAGRLSEAAIACRWRFVRGDPHARNPNQFGGWVACPVPFRTGEAFVAHYGTDTYQAMMAADRARTRDELGLAVLLGPRGTGDGAREPQSVRPDRNTLVRT